MNQRRWWMAPITGPGSRSRQTWDAGLCLDWRRDLFVRTRVCLLTLMEGSHKLCPNCFLMNGVELTNQRISLPVSANKWSELSSSIKTESNTPWCIDTDCRIIYLCLLLVFIRFLARRDSWNILPVKKLKTICFVICYSRHQICWNLKLGVYLVS